MVARLSTTSEEQGTGIADHIHGGEPVRLLIVGPDSEYRSVIQSALGHADTAAPVEAIYLTSMSQARIVLESAEIDAIIAELMLPDGTGDQLLAEAGQLWPATRRILLASESRDRTQPQGAVQAVWDKEAPGYELRRRLERLVAVRRLRQS